MDSQVRVNDALWLVWYDGGVRYVYPSEFVSVAAAQSVVTLRYYQDNGYLDDSPSVALSGTLYACTCMTSLACSMARVDDLSILVHHDSLILCQGFALAKLVVGVKLMILPLAMSRAGHSGL